MVEKENIITASIILLFTLVLVVLILQQWEPIIGLIIIILLALTRYTEKTTRFLLFSITALLLGTLFETRIAVAILMSGSFAKTISTLLRLPYQHIFTSIHYVALNFIIATAVASFFISLTFAIIIGVVISIVQFLLHKQKENTKHFLIYLTSILILALLLQAIT